MVLLMGRFEGLRSAEMNADEMHGLMASHSEPRLLSGITKEMVAAAAN